MPDLVVPDELGFPERCPACGSGWARRPWGWRAERPVARRLYRATLSCRDGHRYQQQLTEAQLELFRSAMGHRPERPHLSGDDPARLAAARRLRPREGRFGDLSGVDPTLLFETIEPALGRDEVVEPNADEAARLAEALEHLAPGAWAPEGPLEWHWNEEHGYRVVDRLSDGTTRSVCFDDRIPPVVVLHLDPARRRAGVALYGDGAKLTLPW